MSNSVRLEHALGKFRAVVRAEERLKRAEDELGRAVEYLDKKEMASYVKETEAILSRRYG